MRPAWQWIQGSDSHENSGLDTIRAFLGLALFIRGCLFIADQSRIMALAQAQDVDWILPVAAFHYVTLAHLFGGFMLAVGLLTRLGAIVQIPVLIGAIVVHLQGGLVAPQQSLELSVLVLFLLCIIAFFGPGPLSLDHRILGKAAVAKPNVDHLQQTRSRVEQAIASKKESSTAAHKHAVTMSVADIPTAGGEDYEFNETTAKATEVFKYLVIGFFGILILLIGMQGIPAGFSTEEFAGVAGVIAFVLGIFYLFYRTALK